MEQDSKNKEGINIELSEEIASGTYSNLAVINHSNSEFVVDFIQIMPGIPKAKVRNEYYSPQHAKRLNSALKENIKKFEDQFELQELNKILTCHKFERSYARLKIFVVYYQIFIKPYSNDLGGLNVSLIVLVETHLYKFIDEPLYRLFQKL